MLPLFVDYRYKTSKKPDKNETKNEKTPDTTKETVVGCLSGEKQMRDIFGCVQKMSF